MSPCSLALVLSYGPRLFSYETCDHDVGSPPCVRVKRHSSRKRNDVGKRVQQESKLLIIHLLIYDHTLRLK